MPNVPQFVVERAAAAQPIFSADEVATWPEGQFDQLVADGILKPAANATSVACNACESDHVEMVDFIESPPGAALRAYIPCPEYGRVQVLVNRLRRWAIDKSKTSLPSEPKTAKKGVSRTRSTGDVHKLSWTQRDLDDAIRKYKAERASTYSDLLAAVKTKRRGAIQSAQAMFGRNAIVRALGVKAPAMVSKSPVWQQIADELGIRGRSRRGGRAPGQRIGMQIALEEQAELAGASTADDVIRRETISIVRNALQPTDAQATIDRLQLGQITDDQARQIAELGLEQDQDNRTRTVRQNL